ncbi:MAG: PAS domain S-box protein [Deltaproteobacteria bacterium]
MFLEYWTEQYGQDSIQGQEQSSLIRFLADIIKNSANPVVACAANGKLIAFNTTFENLCGYAPAELKQLNWLDLIVADGSETFRFNADTEPDYDNRIQLENHLVCKNGSHLPINYYLQAMRFPGDEVICYMAFITDISKQLRLQESIRYQAAFEELLGNISTRFININIDEIDQEIERTLEYIGEFMSADRAYVFIIRHRKRIMSNTYEWCAEGIEAQKENLQDMPLSDFTWWIQQLNISDHLYIPSVTNMSKECSFEKKILLEQDVQSLLVVPMSSHGRLIGFLGFDQVNRTASWSHRDIALLKMLAEIFAYALERKHSSRRLEIAIKTLDNISEGMMTIAQGRITWVNQAFTAITGYNYDEIVGSEYWLLGIPEMDNKGLVREIREYLNQNNTWQGVVTGRHKNGHSFPAATFVSDIQTDNPDQRANFVIFADITEQDRLNQERKRLKHQTAQLQRLNSLSALSGGMVHEIAQPLNSIRVLVDGMLYCHHGGLPLSNSEVFIKLADISLELGRIDEIINHMRSFAHLSNKPELEPCSWNEVVSRALKLLGRQLAAHSICVITDLDPHIPVMMGNLNRLDEVMVNLLVNAMQSLDLSDKEPKEIICRTFTSENRCFLEVTDNGIGIDTELLDQIFEPFVTTKSSYQGMGLGLSVAQSIMNALGGQVKALNRPQGGAIFQLELSAIADTI